MLTPFLYLIDVVIGLTRVQHELPACMAWMGQCTLLPTSILQVMFSHTSSQCSLMDQIENNCEVCTLL